MSTVYVAEAWGTDAFTPLAYLAALTSTIRLATGIVQIGARSPAMLAVSAMTMQGRSGGRFVLGLGTSGPQIMEGWHGVAFRSPIQRPARLSRSFVKSRGANACRTRVRSKIGRAHV